MINLLRKRRSIRRYTSARVENSAVALLVEAALRSPSSHGNNPWEFVVIDDPKALLKLSEAKEHGSSFLKKAPLAIVVCANETKSDVWVEDCSIASILVQMTASSLGLGSCWIQIRKRSHDRNSSSEEYIRNILGLPTNMRVFSIISVGHPDEHPKPLPVNRLEYAKVKYNSYDQPWRSEEQS